MPDDDLSSSKHSGVMGLFNRQFIKTGKMPVEFGKFYSRIFDDRSEGDYGDLLSKPQLSPADFETAGQFIDYIEKLLSERQ